jgi:DNA-binding NtrC family response regulator
MNGQWLLRNYLSVKSGLAQKDPNVPIILISGYLFHDTGKNLLGGSTEYVAKPVDSELMIALVQRLLFSGGKKGNSVKSA